MQMAMQVEWTWVTLLSQPPWETATGLVAEGAGKVLDNIGISSLGSGEEESGKGAGRIGKGFDKDQRALIDLAKDVERKGVSKEEAYILKGWADEYKVYARIDPPHVDTEIDFYHLQVHAIDHIRVSGMP